MQEVEGHTFDYAQACHGRQRSLQAKHACSLRVYLPNSSLQTFADGRQTRREITLVVSKRRQPRQIARQPEFGRLHTKF